MFDHRRVVAFFATSLAACAGDGVTTDETTTRIAGSACSTCKIVAESVAFLGHPDDTVAVGQENLPAADSRGRFYLSAGTGGSILVFGPDGRVMRTFGKGGQGPGEFQRISEIYVAPNDTIVALGGGVVHIVAPEYEHVRQFANKTRSAGFQGTILKDGRMVRRASDTSFVLLDMNGNESQPVALQGIDSSITCRGCGGRVYRAARDGATIWSAPLNAYLLEQHDTTGKLLRRIIRSVDWFKTWGTGPQGLEPSTVGRFSNPTLWGIRQSSDGILWTHVVKLENVDQLPKDLDDGDPKQLALLIASLRTRIEAIDPVRNEVVGEVLLENITFPLTGEYSAQLSVNESGDWAWKIVRFRIERQ